MHQSPEIAAASHSFQWNVVNPPGFSVFDLSTDLIQTSEMKAFLNIHPTLLKVDIYQILKSHFISNSYRR